MENFNTQLMLNDVIPRERLLTLLAPERNTPIRLLCGPAGFGKSILARQFCEFRTASQPIWLDLSASLKLTPTILMQHIAAVVGLDDFDETSLSQFISTFSTPLLVLDDYSPNEQCDTWLLNFIKKNHAQWLITSRRRPEWPLSRLLLNGHLISLESEQLALNLTELTSILDLLSPQHLFCARQLHEQTDGWVAGLRLFLYAQVSQHSLTHIHLHRCPPILDYLDQEVLATMSKSDLDLLKLIAHAPFVDSALCAFLTGETQSLQELLAKQAFLHSISGSTDRFTLYQPLRNVLKERYPDQNQALTPAYHWLKHTGRPLSAFAYAICIAAPALAIAALSEIPLQRLFSENNLSIVLSGLEQLSLNDLIVHPKVLAISIRALLMGGKLELAESYLFALEKHDLHATSLALKAELLLHQGQAQEASIIGAHALIELNQCQDWAQMILCYSCITRAYLALGQYEQAQQQQQQGLELARRKGEMLLECLLLLDLAQVEELAGNLYKALQLLDKTRILISRSHGSALMSAAEQIRRGWLLMLIGDHKAAYAPLEYGLELSMAAGTATFFYSYILLAQLDARCDKITQAHARLAEVQREMYQRGISESIYRSVLSLGNANVGLLTNQHQAVMQHLDHVWLRSNTSSSFTPPSSCPELFSIMNFLHAQVLCVQGAVEQAITILTQVLEKAEEAGFQVIVSQALMALAKARQQQGDTHQAERIMASATAMAMHQGQGQLLSDHLGRITPTANLTDETNTIAQLETHSKLLSQREYMVLELIAKGYSNAEIAEILAISLHTVKAHAKRINAKFQVNSRTLAVARAKTLGLLN